MERHLQRMCHCSTARISIAPIRSHASAWQSEIIRRSNFSISGPTVEFQPESSYATHPHFFKLSMVCALLLNADAFNGATHHFSSILVDYYSNFRPSCFSRFHQDSYWKSCILDVSGNQDGRTELLFVHGNIGIPFMQRQSQGLIVFPQKKPTSIDALGISLDQINTLWVIDTDTPTKQTKTSHPITFHRHLEHLHRHRQSMGHVLHRGRGGQRTILNVSSECPPS